MKELPKYILCEGSGDDDSGVWVEFEDLSRRLHYGWSLQDVIDFEKNKKEKE